MLVKKKKELLSEETTFNPRFQKPFDKKSSKCAEKKRNPYPFIESNMNPFKT
jgi:hypothetical protein